MISFNASTVNKEELSKLNCPFQIMPGGRNSLSSKQIDEFIDMKNPNILIHSSYITRPFSSDITNITRINLRNYATLAHKLGTKDVLIHMPSSVMELTNFVNGLACINKELIDNGCICHLETNPLTKDLFKYLSMNKDNAFDKYENYVEAIWESIPKKYIKNYRIVVDTAHLHANGLNTEEMIRFMDKWKEQIKYVHFNGNANTIFTRDLHVPMYMNKNQLKEVNKLAEHLYKEKLIGIAEDSTVKGSYEGWVEFCEKYKLRLVENNDIFSI